MPPSEASADLLVVGAGPKGLAIAAKAAALEAAGWSVPTLMVAEPEGVAAHWSGEQGFTDGAQSLGTPPEKDLGFPYAVGWGEASGDVNRRMRELSWHGFLCARGTFADWIDRGRPQPTHGTWAEYLRWAAGQLALEPAPGRLTGLEHAADGERWLADLTMSDDRVCRVTCGGVVLTNPGAPRRLPGQPAVSTRVLDGRNVWVELGRLRSRPPRTVCVVGGGETAGAIASALGDVVGGDGSVEVICREGVFYSRGESYTENHRYSDPEGWLRLPERYRRSFLRRTDRGVFSVAVQRALDSSEVVRPVLGTVSELREHPGHVVVRLDDGRDVVEVAYDLVVVATGFDPLWFVPLLGARARAAYDAAVAAAARTTGHSDDGPLHMAEDAIGADLAVVGLRPRLHLPMLAGVAQGAGFPNLSCLGLLADRILGAYAAAPDDLDAATVPAVARREG